jgi:hypothetical protein
LHRAAAECGLLLWGQRYDFAPFVQIWAQRYQSAVGRREAIYVMQMKDVRFTRAQIWQRNFDIAAQGPYFGIIRVRHHRCLAKATRN